jgi:hypothetical protein
MPRASPTNVALPPHMLRAAFNVGSRPMSTNGALPSPAARIYRRRHSDPAPASSACPASYHRRETRYLRAPTNPAPSPLLTKLAHPQRGAPACPCSRCPPPTSTRRALTDGAQTRLPRPQCPARCLILDDSPSPVLVDLNDYQPLLSVDLSPLPIPSDQIILEKSDAATVPLHRLSPQPARCF